MKWVLVILVGLFMLVLLLLGGGFAWIMNLKTDVSDPKFAEKFQASMETFCLQRAKREVANTGQALDYQQEALVKQVCGCNGKAITKILADKKADTPVEMQKALSESQEEAEAAFQSCAQAYGLQ